MKTNYLIFPLLLACLLLNSCDFLEHRLNRPTAVPVETRQTESKPVRTATKPPSAKSKYLEQKQHVARLLEAKDFPAALDLITREVEQGTDEKQLQKEYLSALNGAIAQGESALAEQNPQQAGLLYRAALNNFPKTAELSRNSELPPSALTEKIELCANKLMEDGLKEYRVGNLNKAIEEWQKISSFYPHHKASQKAIQTANVQLANLKKIETDQ